MSHNYNAHNAGMDGSYNDDPAPLFGSVGVAAPVSADWYQGHKVVAMPSSAFGGLSIRDVVSSRNEQTEAATGFNNRPRRSSSLGRQPMRPGRDIVKDVYDRMGVSYNRGVNYDAANNNVANSATGSVASCTSSNYMAADQDDTDNYSANNNWAGPNRGSSTGNNKKDKFSGRYRAAAASARGITSTADRGRTGPSISTAPSFSSAATGEDFTSNNAVVANHNPGQIRGSSTRGREQELGDASEGQRRARSLSRGKAVQGRWPPARDSDNSTAAGIMDTSDKSCTNQNPTNFGKPTPMGPNTNTKTTADSAATAWHAYTPTPSSPERVLQRSQSFDGRPQYGRGAGIGGGFRSNLHYSNNNNNSNNMNTVGSSNINLGGSSNKMKYEQSSLADEKKDSDERSATGTITASTTEEDEAPAPALPSIKDRISAFAGKPSTKGSSSQGKGRRNTFGGPSPSYMKSSPLPPPKVDIYQDIRSQGSKNSNATDEVAVDNFNAYEASPQDYYNNETNNMASLDDSSQNQVPFRQGTSEAGSAADSAVKYGTSNRPTTGHPVVVPKKSSRHSTGGFQRSSIANSYLGGLNSNTNPISSTASNVSSASNRSCFGNQQAPMSPPLSRHMMGGMDDGIGDGGSSVGAASSVLSSGGGEDIIARVRKSATASWKSKSSAPKTNTSHPSSSVTNHNAADNGVSTDMIDRMVDERVQVQLREVEARMEGMLRKWMDQMNNKITSRLDAMEASIKDSMPGPFPREI